MKIIHTTPTSPVCVRGVVSYGFTTNGEWPNEHGEKPDDLIGRAMKQGDKEYVILTCEQIGPGIHHFEVEPL